MWSPETAEKIASGNKPFLVDAIDSGNVDLMKEIVNAGIIPIDSPLLPDGTTALHHAATAFTNSDQMTKFLIDKGADPDTRSTSNDSPFLDAVSKPRYSPANTLVDAFQRKYANDPIGMIDALTNKGSGQESPSEILKKFKEYGSDAAKQLLIRIEHIISKNGAALISGSTSVAAPVLVGSGINNGNPTAISQQDPVLFKREIQRKKALDDHEQGF